MKYKVGDKVRVVAKKGGPLHCFAVGDELVVEELHASLGHIQYCRRYDGYGQWVNTGDLERITNKIVVTTDGETTTARMFSGKTLVKSATAKCSKSDTFDFETGATLAVGRLFDREEKKEVPKFNKADLVDGRFGRMSDGKWFVVVSNRFVYEAGGFDFIKDLDSGGSLTFKRVDCIIDALSFNNARDKGIAGGKVVWTRSGVEI